MKQLFRTTAAVWLAIVLVFGATGSSVSVRAAGPTDSSLQPVLAGSILPAAPDASLYGGVRQAGLGHTLAAVGDVNGDGYADMAVGAPFYGSYTGAHEGRAYLFLGSALGLAATPAWTIAGGGNCGNYYCNVGYSVGAAGDVNGDGYADVIVSMGRWSNGQYDEGRVNVYYGSPAGLSATPNWMVEGNQYRGYFGATPGTAGDVNGDGYDDVIIGSGASYGVGKNTAFVYLGSPTGLSCGAGCPVDATAAAAWTFTSSQATANVGGAVATAGDLNGDGFSDVLVAAPLYDASGMTDAGMVWAFLGSGAGLSSTPVWSVVGDQANAQLGYGLRAAGDVNGDGYDDFVVSAPRYDNGQTDEGRAYLYLGSALGPSAAAAWISEPDRANTAYGSALGALGDLNGDGFADVAAGGLEWDSDSRTNAGKVWVYLGSAAGLAGTAAWTAEGDQAGGILGAAVGAGDVNGDGTPDLLIGARDYDQTYIDGGAVFVYHGSNHPPVAEANGAYTAAEGGSILLDGAGSVDPDPGDIVTYAWDLDNDGLYETPGATPIFAALDGPATHPVALQVCDAQGACDTDAAAVEVLNAAPTAQAGADVTVYRSESLSLTGTWTDPAAGLDEPYAWAWDLDGDAVPDAAGSAVYGAAATATAAFATEGVYALTFTATDADGADGQDSVQVTVLNHAPDCSAVTASPALLWPPDNKFVPVTLGGGVDADGDSLTLTVTAIYQDEPVGFGRSAPDGRGVGAAAAELRAEKLGAGDGRVYTVSFTVSDGHGGICLGEVRVAVPHDEATPAVDGGPLYDSTLAAF